MEKTVSNLIARGTLQLLEDNGVDTSKITERCGISRYEIERDGGRLSENQHYRFMLESANHDQFLAEDMLEYCISYGPVNTSYSAYPDLMGFCLNQTTANAAITSFIENRVIIGNCDSVIVTRGDKKTKIEYVNLGPSQVGNCSAIGNFMMLHSLINSYTSPGNIKVGFVGSRQERKGLLNTFFESKCEFDHQSNFMIIDNTLLDKEVNSSNAALHLIQKTGLNKKRAELEKTKSLSGTVLKLIEHSISFLRSESDIHIMNDVCLTLKMSRWTVNDKLKIEITSFTDLLKSVRLKIACSLLVETNKSIQEISELVCFSSQSVFSRFFKLNLNMSPLVYRNKNLSNAIK